MKAWLSSLMIVGAITASPLYADLVTITTATGAGADSYVRSGSSANSNFGSSSYVISDYANNSNGKYKDYFRFDLTGLTIVYPDGFTPTLNLVTNSNFSNVGFQIYALTDGVPGDALNGWTESGITYNNAPANNTATTGVITDSGATNYMSLVGSYTKSASVGNTVSFALNNSIFQSDTNDLLTLALVRTGSSTTTINFYSAEGNVSKAPSLTVSGMAAAVPEPAEIIGAITLLVAVGGLFLKRFRASASAAT